MEFRFFMHLTVLFVLLAPAQAFWILSHSSLTQGRLDPIVTPGRVSSHVHNVIGASNFGPEVSFDSLMESNCTTAPVQADMSSYWAPQLYYHDHTDNTFTLVPINYVQTYYLQRTQSSTSEILAFPPGFRMVAGSLRTSYNSSNQEDRAVNFVCLDYDGGSSDHDEFPEISCPNGIRAQVIFPSCWDGERMDSEDHKRHVSYPLGGSPDNGDCPSSHPRKFVTLFHEWVFHTERFELQSGVKNFVFATGDETGLTFHADFVSAWDVDVLQAAINECTGALFNNVEGCPPFVPSIDHEKAESCTISRQVNEEIDGPLTALPGCNPVPFTGNAECDGLTTPSIDGYSGGGGDDGEEGSDTYTGTSATSTSASTGTSVVDSDSEDSTETDYPEPSDDSESYDDAEATGTALPVSSQYTDDPEAPSPTELKHCKKKRHTEIKYHKKRRNRSKRVNGHLPLHL